MDNPFLEGSIFRRPLTHWVPARELRVGDYIEGEGEVTAIRTSREQWTIATIKSEGVGSSRVLGAEDQVEVRLEDDGR